jgi:putative ABC transport system permease protein
MFKNYLKVAIRNLQRNKIFSLINIIGLALGMACSLLILLWVQDEKSKDGFHSNKARLFTIYERQYFDGKIEAGYYTPGLLGQEMKKVLPEVQYATDYNTDDRLTFQFGNKIIKEGGDYASEDFFKIFSFPLIQGNQANALNTPVAIAISKKMAKEFFGSPEAAIGKTIRCENRKNLSVSAVFDDMPDHSTIKGDFILNWQFFLDDNSWAKEWGNNGPHTTLMLRADADPAKMRIKIRKFLDAYNKEQGAGFRIELGMQRFDESYLHSDFKNGEISGGRIEYVRLFSIVAIFIMLIACINFMNLTTARSVKRAREIGVRKVVGAGRAGLQRQFIGEAILLALIAVLVSLLLVILLLPIFNNLTRKNIGLPFSSVDFWTELITLAILTGLISGSYPAFFLSAFNPVKVLKGSLKFSYGATLFRKGLVIFQFVLSILLIIGTLLISKQIKYIQTKNLGYEKENLINIPLEGDLANHYKLFKEEALKMSGIRSVTLMSGSPTELDNGTGGVEWDGKDPNSKPMFTQAAIGYDFAKTLTLKMEKGRDFSKDFASDSVGYLINQSALSKIGYKDPVGKPLTFWGKKGTIVGVLKDFHFSSLHKPIAPLVLRFGEEYKFGNALLRIEAGKTKQAVSGLERLCKMLNPKFPFSYSFSDEDYQKLYTSEQVIGMLSNYFAFLAIFISCLGLLGLAIFTAEQRTKEMGIRKVLGASIISLFSLLSKEFLVLVLMALVIASPLAWFAMDKWLQDYAFHIPISGWVFAEAGFLAILIALLTVSFQAIKTAIANPVKSLRTE